MTDVFTTKKRSEVMSLIRAKNTKPEKIVRSYLHRAGFRFRLHNKKLPGTPDLWLPKFNAAVFVNGCYWHRHRGCKLAYTPKQNRSFWEAKFSANVLRDEQNKSALLDRGIRILIIWECALRTLGDCEKNLPKVEDCLLSKSVLMEIPEN
ncbi:very short patch repair endonuclease [Thioalkalivibrio sp. XN279]|uniref:very short patch repair endonuclease n=1 Tax=Thioalkalivibrio sp. XN279 TaxID=2714953 RepID=UPI00140A3931|nr:DNA mismatch endonuclease Vsr [Thioalkalivibrio sp. XN279]NHA14141.1 DNA mismatch endonuclease Vsr [Thioalkalivibrio sp. XN279]